jgi:uncharacterized protein (TIGR03032 family)
MPQAPTEQQLALTCDRYFTAWLAEQHISLAASTYQTNRLLLIGRKDEERLGVFERRFERPMGLYVESDQVLWLATRYQLWRFVNGLAPGQLEDGGGDRLYVPRQSWVTGDLDIHDLILDEQRRPLFVATALNGLATISPTHGCRRCWKPPFISAWVAEDRCHLNGLARRDGRARYVTAVAATDGIDGWRDRRADGGLVMDLDSEALIATGLSMPHSPRWYRDRLWLLNAGSGDFGFVDLDSGRFEPVAFCPGYARGLAFQDRFAIIGLSQPRDASFTGLPLDERLAAKGLLARCGLIVVDLDSGQVAHWLRFEGVITELYDLQVLPGVRRPLALGFQADTIATRLFLEPDHAD